MRRLFAAALAAGTLLASPVFAVPLGGAPQTPAGRFNEAAAMLGSNQRIVLKQCQGSAQDSAIAVCTFSVGPGTSLIAVSEQHGPAMDAVFATFEGAQAQESLASVLRVTMMLFAPESSEAERWVAVRSLARDLEIGKPTSTTLDGVMYRLAVLNGQIYRLAIMR